MENGGGIIVVTVMLTIWEQKKNQYFCDNRYINKRLKIGWFHWITRQVTWLAIPADDRHFLPVRRKLYFVADRPFRSRESSYSSTGQRLKRQRWLLYLFTQGTRMAHSLIFYSTHRPLGPRKNRSDRRKPCGQRSASWDTLLHFGRWEFHRNGVIRLPPAKVGENNFYLARCEFDGSVTAPGFKFASFVRTMTQRSATFLLCFHNFRVSEESWRFNSQLEV